jgi:hypothetical protein
MHGRADNSILSVLANSSTHTQQDCTGGQARVSLTVVTNPSEICTTIFNRTGGRGVGSSGSG